LSRVKIKPGDFFYVPSGTIHALGEGTLVLETQQSSDTTYRLYDYDRPGQDGKPRELHIEKSIDVSTIPHQVPEFSPEVSTIPGAVMTKFVEAEFFTVHKWDIDGTAKFEQNQPFMLLSVLEGDALLSLNKKTYPIKKGDHLILPSGTESFQLEGKTMLIVSHL